MTQISNSSMIIFETYNYRDHREDSTRTKPTALLNTLASMSLSCAEGTKETIFLFRILLLNNFYISFMQLSNSSFVLIKNNILVFFGL